MIMQLLGKLIKYLLWVCFASLLAAFVFGLFGFDGNFGEYVRYLNSIGIDGLMQFDSKQKICSKKITDKNQIYDSLEIPVKNDVEDFGILDDDYFNPKVNDFGFSTFEEGNNKVEEAPSNTGSLINDESLINLIKSHEK